MSEASKSSALAKPRRPRSVSFRTSLLRNLTFLILALAIAILTVSFVAARRAVRTLCQDLVHSGTDHVEADLRRIFAPVPPVLRICREWSEQGLLHEDDPENLNNLLAPLMGSLPQIAGISLGYSDGNGFLIARDEEGDGFINQLVTPDTAGKTSRWISWKTLDGPREERLREDRYDPRTRPWYLNIEIRGEDDHLNPTVHWTDPYPFFSTREPGITASLRLHDSAGRDAVVSIDLLLESVSRLSETLEVSPNGFMTVTTSDIRTIGLPNHPDLADPERRRAAFLKNPRDLGIPLFAEASRHIRDHFNLPQGEVMDVGLGLSEYNQPFRWTFEGAGWWTYARPCVIEEGPQLWIGVAVPEDDFLGELQAGRKYYYALAGLALLVAFFMSARLSHRYSYPIQALIRQSDRLRTLNTERIETLPSGILEITQLNDAHESMRLALDSFAKYVPSDVVRELLDKGEAAVIGGRNTTMSILFTDIEGFTSIAEKMTPADLTTHMASYFDAMIGIITEHDGIVDKLIGDAIVALWSAPKVNKCHARDSVRSALHCHNYLQKLNTLWEEQGLPRLPTRFGISTGEVVVGNVGSSNRLSYTVLGDAVNLASRLEAANKYYGTRIIASANTFAETSEEFTWRKLDKVRVVGRTEPELIYELLGETGKVPAETLAAVELYESALEAYLARDFDRTLARLDELLDTHPNDKSYSRLAHLAREAIEVPPPPAWDGVSEFKQK